MPRSVRKGNRIRVSSRVQKQEKTPPQKIFSIMLYQALNQKVYLIQIFISQFVDSRDFEETNYFCQKKRSKARKSVVSLKTHLSQGPLFLGIDTTPFPYLIFTRSWRTYINKHTHINMVYDYWFKAAIYLINLRQPHY